MKHDLDATLLARKSGMAPPFPGLRPFSSRDHKYFFGREDQTFALYRLLRNNHFVAVIGSSGSGKSSIVRAGLLPLLDEENRQSDKPVWQWKAMRPGRNPIDRLSNALAKNPNGEHDAFFEARRDRIASKLRASSNGIFESLAHTTPNDDTQLVLLVDQFEELFRYLSTGPQASDRFDAVRRREEATKFVQLLLTATRSYDSRVRVVITMRSDFIGDCARFQGLPEAVSTAQFLVPSLTRDQREEAIRKPIELSGATIDSELVERFLNDSGDDFDQLPVLQHCLARLWMRADETESRLSEPSSTDSPVLPATTQERHLTEQDYKDIGGLAGALSAHADSIVKSLAGREQTVEQVFRALAEVDKEGRAIRRARTLSQLIAETGADRDDVFAVLDAFRADDCSFLVPPLSLGPSSTLPDETVIDVGHEALLRRWTRVSGEPDATGERGDKRDVGWLRQEQKDGERYQFLYSCVDPESQNESRLSDDQTRRYWNWWDGKKPNPAWAARYGGKFADVDKLINTSYKDRQRSKAKKTFVSVCGLMAAVVVSAVLFLSWKQRHDAEALSDLTLNSTVKFSQIVLDSFNGGQISAEAASKLEKEAGEVYKNSNRVNKNSGTAAAESRWLLTTADIQTALGNKSAARASALGAMSNARKYQSEEPDNRGWQVLLFESLFRLGDLDLDESIAMRNQKDFDKASKDFDQASLEYQESQRIAGQLLSYEIAHPQELNVSGPDHLAKQRFDLAFAINKNGEAMEVKADLQDALAAINKNGDAIEVKGDLRAALAIYNQALELAKMIEGATKMEWKLQSATTRIKIAHVFLNKAYGNLDGAIQFYSEAIAREEAVFAENKTDNIVRSNLGAAYQGRANVLLKVKQFDAAFRDYEAAAKLFTELAEEDSRNTDWLERLARARSRYGAALESYERAQGLPLDKAIEQYKKEILAREKLVQRAPSNDGWQKSLRESQDNLQRVTASASATPVTSAVPE
jgi:tetratricopeptide (TPR) repeat protein